MKKLILSIILITSLRSFAQSSTMLPSAVQIPTVLTLGTCTFAEKGQQVLLSTDGKMYYCNSTAWVEMGFSLPYSGNAAVNAPTHLFKLDNGGTGFVAHFNVGSTSNPNGGLYVTNLGTGNAVYGINSNASSSSAALKGFTLGTGFAGEFSSSNATPKALKTFGGLQFAGISEGANKVLTSDANGNATWQTFTVPTSTKYFNASNMDFLPNRTQTAQWNAFTRDNYSTRIACFSTSVGEAVYMIAPIDLPHGAIVNQMESHYIDNTSAETLFFELIRRSKSTLNITTEDVMASAQSAATNSASIRTITDNTVSNATIDNDTYYYFIKVSIGDCGLCSEPELQQWRGSLLGVRTVELQYTY